MKTRTFRVPNIMCDHCVMSIRNEVGSIPGVGAVSADKDSKKVTVEWEEPPASWDAIRAKLVGMDYPPEGA